MTVLRTLENRPDGLTIAQIVRASSLPRSTVNRIVTTLAAEQFLLSGEQGRISLGPALTRLALAAHSDILDAARPHLEMLGRVTNETINFSTLRGAHTILLAQYDSACELRVVSPLGSALPLHCTAHGKALLAGMSDAAVTELLQGPMETRTAWSLSTLEDVLEHLAEVRQTGIGYDREEYAAGVCALGMQVRAGTPDLYAVSIAMPAPRFSDDALTRAVPALRRCVAAIEAAAGHRP